MTLLTASALLTPRIALKRDGPQWTAPLNEKEHVMNLATSSHCHNSRRVYCHSMTWLNIF